MKYLVSAGCPGNGAYVLLTVAMVVSGTADIYQLDSDHGSFPCHFTNLR